MRSQCHMLWRDDALIKYDGSYLQTDVVSEPQKVSVQLYASRMCQ